MGQMTWRAPDELQDLVRAAAAAEGRSANEFLTRLAMAATDPDLAGSEWERTLERLRRAGLLVEPGPPRTGPRADPELVEEARREAGKSGVLLSDLISEGRGPR
jgi:hypothetical protein